MIDFMNAISPSFVAFAVVVAFAPVATYLIWNSFRSVSEERKLRYAKEGEGLKMSHEEKMSTIKQIDACAIEHQPKKFGEG